MVRSSIFKDEQYNIYELHAEERHIVTSGEETDSFITIAGVEPHAVVTADVEYARAYIDGKLENPTGITSPSSNTRVTFGSLTEGQVVSMYFPVAGTGCGSLVSNINTGKLTLPRIQTIQSHNTESTMVPVLECGADREGLLDFAPKGTITLGLNRHGNMAVADLIAARAGKDNGDNIFLLIDVIDTTEAVATHDLLIEAMVEGYEDRSEAEESISGIVTDIFTFSFVPDVVTL